MTHATESNAYDSRGVRLLQATAFVSSLDRAAIAPLLVPIARDLGRSVSDVTLAATVYLFAYGMMQLVWATASDRFGRVRIMQVALVIAGLAGIASAAAPNLTFLIGARTLAGAAFAAAVPGALVFIGDTVPIRIRPMALADLATGTAAGFTVGTVGAAFLSEQIGWRVSFGIVGTAGLVLAVLVGRLREPRTGVRARLHRQIVETVRHRSTLLVLSLALVEGFLVLGLLVFLPATLQLSGVSTAQAGGVTAAYGVAVIATSALVKRRSRRAVPHRVMATGGVMAVVAFALLALASTPATVLLAATCLGASWAQLHTSLQAWATEVRPESRALVVSTFAACLFTGSAAGTWAGGTLLTGGHVALLFGGAALLTAVLTVVATAGRMRQRF